MRTISTILSIAAAGLMLAGLQGSATAATAHNSQAGAYGSTKNNCAATPYFPPDSGCLSSYIQGQEDDDILPPPDAWRTRYRARPPLQ